MLKEVSLRHFMLTNPVKVNAEASLLEAIHLILVNKVSGICVVDAEDRLVGVLSELDCLRGALSATYNDAGIGTVREAMASTDLQVARPDDAIVDIAADMLANRRRRRPVVDEHGRLIGQVSIRQILRAVKEFSSPADHREQD